MDQRTIDFADAVKHYNETWKQLSNAKDFIRNFAHLVETNPANLYFANCSVAALSTLTINTKNVLDAREWPSADHLQTLINELYKARQNVERLQKLVPEDEKSLVQKPFR